MDNPIQSQLIADITRDLVVQTAPQELPLFRATSEAYFKNPERIFSGQKGKDETLGFGVGAAVTFLTPFIFAIMTEVVEFIVEEVKKSAKEESSLLITDAVKNMFKKVRSEEKDAPPALRHEQLARVRQVAFEKARSLKLSESQAGLLADSVVGTLAVTTP